MRTVTTALGGGRLTAARAAATRAAVRQVQRERGHGVLREEVVPRGAHDGLDAEAELANILSTEILAELNRTIIRTVNGVAVAGAQVGTTNGGIFDLDTKKFHHQHTFLLYCASHPILMYFFSDPIRFTINNFLNLIR